ncbi:hypothetical protein [Hymenobacter terrestris]|uniref:Lipoprotein n=1 Tax=Hymenobacter terrestris TaxID=2748310 RepID=A0ABX2PX26_9BACT|nr:hypothetical protein [Hymenobacter terrestris]NVO83258.1 hypothetical protein [Hymenobacter terrestris]
MHKPILATICLVICALSACKKNENMIISDENQTLVFGSFFGECEGEKCVEIYLVDSQMERLAENTTDAYPRSNVPLNGSFTELSAAQYEQVKDLPALFPAELLTEQTNVIGAPDAADQGGYYVEVTRRGVRRHWLIDTDKKGIPTYLHPFVDSLSVRLKRLP